MNTTIISILTTISISFSMINARGQTCPNKALQRQMQTEETAFLANMKPGLQHTQMLAVRDAMKGDYSALEQIRQSRNQAPVLPETVESKYVTSDICLFFLSMPLNVNVLYCFISMAEDGVSEA